MEEGGAGGAAFLHEHTNMAPPVPLPASDPSPLSLLHAVLDPQTIALVCQDWRGDNALTDLLGTADLVLAETV